MAATFGQFPANFRFSAALIVTNFAETLQFEDLVFKKFFPFYYVHIFVKKSWIGSKCIFYECWKKSLKTFCGKKSLCVQRA